MARPARPAQERRAVIEAANLVRAETGLTSAKGIARAIATRVVVEMLADLQRDDFTAALAKAENQFAPCPIFALATCEQINTVGAFVDRQCEAVRARSGRYLRPIEQEAERRDLMMDLIATLERRYDHHIRSESSVAIKN
jgi:hypothetical protein